MKYLSAQKKSSKYYVVSSVCKLKRFKEHISSLHLIPNTNSGFTFVEIVITMAIASTLLGIISMNLLKIHQTKTVQSVYKILVSDLKSQQTKAMSLSAQNTSSPGEYGVHFETNSYTLFKGTSYNPSDQANAEIELPENFSFSNVTLPSTQVVFTRGSGEVLSFTNGQNSLTINNFEGDSITLEINPYGAIE